MARHARAVWPLAGCPLGACSGRFARWRRDGTWDRLPALEQSAAAIARELARTVRIDGPVVRSRGGRTTKLHRACDGRGRVLAIVLTPGQRHERAQLGPVCDAIRVPRPGGRGRPRKRPDHIIADKGYSYPTCRRLLRRKGIAHIVPERRARNVVERCVGWLKRWRAVATRYGKWARNFRAGVVIAALLRWIADVTMASGVERGITTPEAQVRGRKRHPQPAQ